VSNATGERISALIQENLAALDGVAAFPAWWVAERAEGAGGVRLAAPHGEPVWRSARGWLPAPAAETSSRPTTWQPSCRVTGQPAAPHGAGFLQQKHENNRKGTSMWPDHAGHMGWMWLWWVVGLALLVAIVWAVMRAAMPTSAGDRPSPEAILKGRYARGEIDQQEYERRLADLRK
jgi:putative membrane protein